MKTILVILDGWGIAPPGPGNFISLAKTPFFDSMLKNFPNAQLKASGKSVGLPENAMGNSEVGHLHIGAGRVVVQPISFIDRQIETKEFFENPALKKAIAHAKKHKSALHLMGLCSDGLVHSSIAHLFALIEMAKKNGLEKVFIHFFADGRDVPEKSALKYIEQIKAKISEAGIGKIASVAGRFYAMDRDNNYGRTKKAFELLTHGKGERAASAEEAIKNAYGKGDRTDYYIRPTAITENGKPVAIINDSDAVVFFNTRTDRIRQLIKCFTLEKFDAFKIKKAPKVFFSSFVQTDKAIPQKKCAVAFTPNDAKNNLGQVISKHGLKQLRIAETEKYAHVTYFFNSQKEKPNKGEKRIMVPSEKVASYDKKPEMSANQITKQAIKSLMEKKFDFILVNYANADLVGHTADSKAIVKAVETLDKCVETVCEKALEKNYAVIVSSDHGNAEEKISKTGEKIPSHSTNKVPFILCAKDKKFRLKKQGSLTDIAPTIIELMGLKKPKEMTGNSLIER